VDINIELIADNLPEVTNIYITGNNNQLGDWQLYEVELNEIEKGTWSKNFHLARVKSLSLNSLAAARKMKH